MSCNAFTTVPAPPTAQMACAVPVGGSNSSILDTCCNGHINAIATYAAPGSSSTAQSDNGCFQFCVTDNTDYVSGCLINTLGEYSNAPVLFECFNTGLEKKETGAKGSGYGSAGTKAANGGGWVMSAILGLSLIGAVANAI